MERPEKFVEIVNKFITQDSKGPIRIYTVLNPTISKISAVTPVGINDVEILEQGYIPYIHVPSNFDPILSHKELLSDKEFFALIRAIKYSAHNKIDSFIFYDIKTNLVIDIGGHSRCCIQLHVAYIINNFRMYRLIMHQDAENCELIEPPRDMILDIKAIDVRDGQWLSGTEYICFERLASIDEREFFIFCDKNTFNQNKTDNIDNLVYQFDHISTWNIPTRLSYLYNGDNEGEIIAMYNSEHNVEDATNKDNDYNIKVEGEFHQFEGGGVRYNKNKGRFDLIPEDAINIILNNSWEYFFNTDDGRISTSEFDIMGIAYSDLNDINNIVELIIHLVLFEHDSRDDDSTDDNDIPYTDEDGYPYWLACFNKTLLDLAIHYQKGAEKYGVDNWKKGIPVWSFIDSGRRHMTQYLLGCNDEPHFISAIWNFVCAIWCINKNYCEQYNRVDVEESPEETEVTKDTEESSCDTSSSVTFTKKYVEQLVDLTNRVCNTLSDYVNEDSNFKSKRAKKDLDAILDDISILKNTFNRFFTL